MHKLGCESGIALPRTHRNRTGQKRIRRNRSRRKIWMKFLTAKFEFLAFGSGMWVRHGSYQTAQGRPCPYRYSDNYPNDNHN